MVTCLILDEVVFDDDDDDEPIEPSKPIVGKSIVKPVEKTPIVAEVQPAVQVVEVKPRTSTLKAEKSVPSDLLAARKKMISTRYLATLSPSGAVISLLTN